MNIADKFLNIDNFKIIIGPGCVTGLRAILPLIEEHNALTFSTGLLDDVIFEESDNVLNFATQISTEAKFMAEEISSTHIKSVAIVHGKNFFGEEFARALQEDLQSKNIIVNSVQSSDLDEKDFRTIITKLMEDNPEVIAVHQGQTQMGLFARQSTEFDVNSDLYMYYGVESESSKQAGGKALNDIFYTFPINHAEDSKEKKEFERRYAGKFNGKIPSPTSYFVYDGMMLLDKALDECSQDDTGCIKAFFENYGVYEGISGKMEFTEKGTQRPFGIKTIQNGEYVWVKK